MRLNLWPLALILTTARTLKDWQAAATRGPVVVIRPGREGDAGLLAHELMHVQQFWTFGLPASAVLGILGLLYGLPPEPLSPAFLGLLLNPLCYALWPKWRLAAEVAAYRVQAMYYVDDRRPMFAEFLSTRYTLNITAAEALRRLRED